MSADTTVSTPHHPDPAQRAGWVDLRAARFAAWLTSAVLVAGLLTGSAWVLAAQTVVFGLGAFLGMRTSPYGWVFRTLIAPRLGPATSREPAAPARFAQLVGFGFGVLATIGYLSGATVLGAVAAGLALAAALLNATTGFCVGCELYLLGTRLRTPTDRHHSTTNRSTPARTTVVRTSEGV